MKYKIKVVWKEQFGETIFYAIRYLTDGKLLKIISPIEGQVNIVTLDNVAYVTVNVII